MDHEEERNNEPEFQEMFQVNIINFLRKVCGLEEYEESEIYRIIGIIRTNALQVRINILFNVKWKILPIKHSSSNIWEIVKQFQINYTKEEKFNPEFSKGD